MTRKIGALVLVLVLVLSACVEESDASLGEADQAQSAQAADTVGRTPPPAHIVASLTEWNVALSHVHAAAGTISVDVQNNGREVHALEIEGGGQEWRSDAIQPGETMTMSVVLPAGTYDVYCPIASGGEAHADRGMKTTLQVR